MPAADRFTIAGAALAVHDHPIWADDDSQWVVSEVLLLAVLPARTVACKGAVEIEGVGCGMHAVD